jgi:4-amino-4-deoxy-L-arabinose transferase-like glycosyltransferase
VVIRWAVPALLMLALAVRVVALIATPAYVPLHDDRDYDRLACWISDHGVPPDRIPPAPGPRSCSVRGDAGAPTAYRPPLWPLALGGTYAVAEAFDLPRWTAGRALQAVIGTLIVALTGAIAARAGGATAGLLAMALGAVFLPLVLVGSSLISEPLFVALELAAVVAVLRYRRSAGVVGWAVAAGALVGLAALTRSNGALLAVPLIVAIGAQPGRRRFVGVAAFAAAAVLVVAPWTLRNEVVLGAFVPVSTGMGPTLLGTYNATSRDLPGCTGCWIMLRTVPAERRLARRVAALTEPERDRESRALAARFALRHPGYVLQVAWDNSLRLLELAGVQRTRFTATTIGVSPRAAVLGAWQLWLIIAAAALGAAAGALRRLPPGLLALVGFLWLTTALVSSETPRFRAPIDPFLLIVAAIGLPVVGGRAAGSRPAGSPTDLERT